MSDLPVGLEGTGVFATGEEQDKAFALAEEAARTPVILMFGKYDLAGDARRKVETTVHAFALNHGLPKIQGYYGMNVDGEFIKEAGQ